MKTVLFLLIFNSTAHGFNPRQLQNYRLRSIRHATSLLDLERRMREVGRLEKFQMACADKSYEPPSFCSQPISKQLQILRYRQKDNEDFGPNFE